jgi:hypothetical protein
MVQWFKQGKKPIQIQGKKMLGQTRGETRRKTPARVNGVYQPRDLGSERRREYRKSPRRSSSRIV